MKQIFEKLNHAIGFTPSEGKIVYFLVGAFLIGGALKLAGVAPAAAVQTNYSSEDSLFAQKSGQLALTAAAPDSTDDMSLEENEDETASVPAVSYPLDLNRATKEMLMTLPGIGDAMADRIIKYRTELGKFSSIDQLMNIKGIGEHKFEQLKPYLSLEH